MSEHSIIGLSRPSLLSLTGNGRAPSVSRRRARMMISSAGRRVSLLRCFRSSAQALGLDLDVYACDLEPEWSAACLEADKAFAAPPTGSEAFVPEMLELCQRENIGLIVPTNDGELIGYSRAREEFAAIGTRVVVGAAPLVTMARDKLATANFLASAGIKSPRTVAVSEFLAGRSQLSLPLLAKPRHGSSSRGIAVVETSSQLAALAANEPYIVQEYLRGRELTVSMYFNFCGVLTTTIAHERVKVRAGEVEKGVTVRLAEIDRIARELASAMQGPLGPMCFQVKLDESEAPSVFEINARLGGGYPLAHEAGAQFTRWILEEWQSLPTTANDQWRQDVVMLRFDDAVFV